jgi:hypothetical protein
MVFFNLSVFGKRMKKYILACESYLGRTYGISFIEKIKILSLWKK